MNDVPQEAWFYSHEGERIGPVTFAELRAKAQAGELNPRLDLAWKYGMDQWLPSGGIQGLFERRDSEESLASMAATPDTSRSAGGESVRERMKREGDWPGARRRSYLIAIFIFPVLWAMGFAAAEGFLEKQLGAELTGYAKAGMPLVPLIVSVIYGVKRLMNVGMSGWWFLGNFIPLLNLWVGFRSFACPAGYAFHKKLDGVGIFLAIVYWLIAIAALAIVAVGIAAFFSVAGNPELQAKIQELVRESLEKARPQ
jgi:hypothetical protein